MAIRHKKCFGILCPFCLEENVYSKPNYKSKYVCRSCNKFVVEKQIIKIPFEWVQERQSLIVLNKYIKLLEGYKTKVKEKGKVGDVYVEINLEV